MTRDLRVGIIGASAGGGWAKVSHVPAVQKLAGLQLAAVATTSQESADAAAKAFSARRAYGNPADMLSDPEIDIVAVCVKVPDHRSLVLDAIAAGKHVYCEWPLGRDVAESEEMAAAAQATGVHAVIGLQTRMNPAVQRARELRAAGAVGRLLSARVYSSTAAFGPGVPPSMMYAEEGANGVTLVTVQGGHTVDLAVAVLGSLKDLTALATTQYPEIEIGDEKTLGMRSTPDHVLVQSRFAEGGALSIEIAGGRPPETPFRLEATGDTGVLALDGGAPRGFQSGRLRLSLNHEQQAIDEGETGAMPDEAVNVAAVYAALRDDILHDTATVSDFNHAVRLRRLIDDIQGSARTGTRKSADNWPTR